MRGNALNNQKERNMKDNGNIDGLVTLGAVLVVIVATLIAWDKAATARVEREAAANVAMEY